MSTDVMQAARRAYDIATRGWHEQRANGGIERLDPSIPEDSDELSKGAKYKATTPAAKTVLGVWQKCKAELDAAAANHRRSLGDESCPTCPKKDEKWIAPEPDRRLPPERDDAEISP
jgi:hypothetical protein